MAERLQKLLATAGVASRRASEALILSGRVTVNGKQVRELGAKADPADDIRVDGQKLRAPAPQTYILLHKPPGYTSTVSDPHAARTVMELLPAGAGRVFPAGRLDRESEGLLLLTDDGALTQRLLHPSFHLPKEYAVLVRGRLSEATLRRLRAGAVVEGRRTAPVEVEPVEPPRWAGAGPPDSMWLRFVLREGRKRQIRETCAEAGVAVERLIRTRMGPLALGTLPPSKTRRLTPHEVASLRRACGLDAPGPVVAASPDAPGRTGPAPLPSRARMGAAQRGDHPRNREHVPPRGARSGTGGATPQARPRLAGRNPRSTMGGGVDQGPIARRGAPAGNRQAGGPPRPDARGRGSGSKPAAGGERVDRGRRSGAPRASGIPGPEQRRANSDGSHSTPASRTSGSERTKGPIPNPGRTGAGPGGRRYGPSSSGARSARRAGGGPRSVRPGTRPFAARPVDQSRRDVPNEGVAIRRGGTRPVAGHGGHTPADQGRAGTGPRRDAFAPIERSGERRAQPRPAGGTRGGGRSTAPPKSSGRPRSGRPGAPRERGTRISGRAPNVPDALVRSGAKPRGVRRAPRN